MGSFFKKLSNARFGSGKWFTDGNYVVKISDIKYVQGGYRGDSIIIESDILGIRNQLPSEKAPKVGERAVQVIKASGEKEDMGRGNWMNFVCALAEESLESRTDAEWEEFSEELIEGDFAKDTEMYLEVFTKTTQKGGEFTVHNWLRIATDNDKQSMGC
jgi:hypothetical protein